MFINLTNHPSEQWGEKQKVAAQKYGKIVDIPFPLVDPAAAPGEISALAGDYTRRILEMQPKAVLCQGEFSFAFAMVTELKKLGVAVLAACSERRATECIQGGTTKKVVEFEFVQFREY